MNSSSTIGTLDQTVTILFLKGPEIKDHESLMSMVRKLEDTGFWRLPPSGSGDVVWERRTGDEPNQMYQSIQNSKYGYGVIDVQGRTQLCKYRAVLGPFPKIHAEQGVDPTVRATALAEFKEFLTRAGLSIEGETSQEFDFY